MTKSTIARERLEELAAGQSGFNLRIASHEESQELARMALSAMDSEPVGEFYEDGPLNWYQISDGDRVPAHRRIPLYRHAQPAPEYPETLPCPVFLEPGLRFGKGIKTSVVLAALARRAVYESDMAALSPEEKAEFQARIEDFKALIAQPAPVVTFYRDGIEVAAKWIDQQREAYDSEHGWSDPDTGAFEFGNDAQRDYSAMLEEIADGIRGLHPNTAQPSQVVPDEKPMPEASKMHAIDAVAAIAEVRGWNACRAAMLQAGNCRENSNSSTNNFREIAETSTSTAITPAAPDKQLTDDVLDEIIAGAKTSMEQYLALSLKAEREAWRQRQPTDDERIMAIEGIHNCERCSDEGWIAGEMRITRCACGHAGNSPVIPDGWKLVPVEPNGDMLAAAQDAYGETDGDIASTLRTAIAAAPQEVKP